MLPAFFAKSKKFLLEALGNKKLLSLFLLLAILVSLLPLQTARASLTDKFAEGITRILVGSADLIAIPLTIVFGIVQMVTGILPYTGAEFLNACVKLNFIKPLTPAHPDAANTALMAGWQYTRGLANIVLVIILAWIAFATILRIKSYQLKTLLPKVLIIALLINFIPVITGIIVDISNILTNYFADKSSGAAQWFWNASPVKSLLEMAAQDRKSLIPSEGGWMGLAAQGAMGIAFNIISWGILLGYGLVFLARVALIWLLIILAPLAWLGYLTPGGKRFWNMWWNQFLLWCFIGVPMLFFLYLGGLILSKGMTACDINLDQLGSAGLMEGVMAETMSKMLCNSRGFIVAIITMIVGAGISMTLMPKGVGAVINQGKKASSWAGKKFTDKAKHWKNVPGEMMPDSVQKWGERQAAAKDVLAPQWGAGQTGLGGAFKRGMAKIASVPGKPINWARHKTGRTIGVAVSETQRKAIAEAEKSVKSEETVAGITERIHAAPDQATKTGLINKLIKEGDLDDAIKAGLTQDEIKTVRQYAKKHDMHKDIDSALPHFAQGEMNEKLAKELAKLPADQRYTDLTGAYATELIGKVKPNRASQMSDSVFEKDSAGKFMHEEVMDAMIKKWSGSHMGNLLSVKGDDRSKAIEDRIADLATAAGATPKTWLDANNKPLADWIEKSPAARGFFASIV